MSMTVSTRVEHRPTRRASGQRDHDLRHGVIPKYVFQSLTHQNSVIIEPLKGHELRAICEERRSQRDTKRAMKLTAAVSTNGIITFGVEAQSVIDSLPVAEQDALYLKAAQTIAKRLDTDLTGLVVHRDETTGHGHYQMPAVNRSGKPLSKVITPSVAKELQDIVGAVYGELGVTRGKAKIQRIRDGEPAHTWNHRTVKQLHEDLPKELEAALAKIEKNERLAETGRAKVAEIVAKGKEASADAAKAQKLVETYEKRIADAKKAFGDMPEAEVMTIVKSRQQRLFGLLPDKVETVKVKAIPKSKMDAAVVAQGQKLDKRESELDRKASVLYSREVELNADKKVLERKQEAVQQLSADAQEKMQQANAIMREALALKAQAQRERGIDSSTTELSLKKLTEEHTREQARTRSRDRGLSR